MTLSNFSSTIEILLVEDDPADVELTKEGLARAGVSVALNVVTDGVEAMDYLQKKGRYNEVKTPDLIVLDLNLPRKDGRELLRELKSDDRFRHVPIVVLTTSDSGDDIMETYSAGANSFVTKPIGIDNWEEMVSAIEKFWLNTVVLPSRVER